MNKHLYIDLSYTCHRLLFSVKGIIMEAQKSNKRNEDTEGYEEVDAYGILRHTVLTDIFDNIMSFKPDRVVIACDHKKSWRKKYYEGYKAQRKERRDKDDLDYSTFYEFLNSFIAELQSVMPFMTLQIPNLEGDDIIAQLVKMNHHDNDITFVTADQDYYQLMQYDNVSMYDPLKKILINKSRAEALNDLEVKILMGDKSDNIPACRPKLGQKTAEKLILGEPWTKKSGLTLDDLMNESEFKKNYDRNTKLINMNYCPKGLVDRLKNEVEEYEFVGISAVFDYFRSNRLKELMGKSSIIAPYLSNLDKYNNMAKEESLFFESDS